MSIQEFINYTLAKLGDNEDSQRLANRLLALLNYNPILAKEALDATYHDSVDPNKISIHKDTPEWIFRYKNHDITLNHGLVLIDNKIANWNYNPSESLMSVIDQVLRRVDELVKEESLQEIRYNLIQAPPETREAFNKILQFFI